MILNVNFRYQASVVPKGKRTPVTRIYRGSVPVEIVEATAEEAPVALAFVEYGRGGARQPVELRLVGETLVRPFLGEAQAPRDAAWIRALAESGYRTPDDDDAHVLAVAAHAHERSDLALADDADVRSVGSSTEASRAAAVRERAGRLFLVGGVLHEPSPEPVYRVMRGVLPGRGGGGGSPIRPVFLGAHPHEDPQDVYRADELAVLLQGRMIDPPAAEDIIDVRHPAALRHDAPGRELRRAADLALGVLKSGIEEGDEAYFRDYMRLRDAVRACEAGASPDALVEPLRDVVERERVTDFYLRRAEHALERMDARALAQIDVPGP